MNTAMNSDLQHSSKPEGGNGVREPIVVETQMHGFQNHLNRSLAERKRNASAGSSDGSNVFVDQIVSDEFVEECEASNLVSEDETDVILNPKMDSMMDVVEIETDSGALAEPLAEVIVTAADSAAVDQRIQSAGNNCAFLTPVHDVTAVPETQQARSGSPTAATATTNSSGYDANSEAAKLATAQILQNLFNSKFSGRYVPDAALSITESKPRFRTQSQSDSDGGTGNSGAVLNAKEEDNYCNIFSRCLSLEHNYAAKMPTNTTITKVPAKSQKSSPKSTAPVISDPHSFVSNQYQQNNENECVNNSKLTKNDERSVQVSSWSPSALVSPAPSTNTTKTNVANLSGDPRRKLFESMNGSGSSSDETETKKPKAAKKRATSSKNKSRKNKTARHRYDDDDEDDDDENDDEEDNDSGNDNDVDDRDDDYDDRIVGAGAGAVSNVNGVESVNSQPQSVQPNNLKKGAVAETDGEETETAPENEFEGSVTRCVCDYEHDDGYMICCDKCSVWQHVDCMGIDKSSIPDDYLCEECNPRYVNKEWARQLQSRKKIEMMRINSRQQKLKKNQQQQQQQQPQRKLPATANSLRKSVPAAAELSAAAERIENGSAVSKKRDPHSQASAKRQYRRRKNPAAASSSKENDRRPRRSDSAHSKKNPLIDTNAPPNCNIVAPVLNNTNDLYQQAQAQSKPKQWIDSYEEAVINHYSAEFRTKLLGLKTVTAAFNSFSLPINMPNKCKISLKTPGCVKILLATTSVSINSPVIELKGKFMLTNEYLKQKHANGLEQPNCFNNQYIFHYRLPKDSADISVDTNTYGNDARFVRRSCRPNSEIRHCLDKGKFHLYIVAINMIEKNTEITIRHDHWNENEQLPCACANLNNKCLLMNKAASYFAVKESAERKQQPHLQTHQANRSSKNNNALAAAAAAPSLEAATGASKADAAGVPTANAASTQQQHQPPPSPLPLSLPNNRRVSQYQDSPLLFEPSPSEMISNGGAVSDDYSESEMFASPGKKIRRSSTKSTTGLSNSNESADSNDKNSSEDKLSREERKMIAILKRFETMEKSQKQKREYRRSQDRSHHQTSKKTASASNSPASIDHQGGGSSGAGGAGGDGDGSLHHRNLMKMERKKRKMKKALKNNLLMDRKKFRRKNEDENGNYNKFDSNSVKTAAGSLLELAHRASSDSETLSEQPGRRSYDPLSPNANSEFGLFKNYANNMNLDALVQAASLCQTATVTTAAKNKSSATAANPWPSSTSSVPSKGNCWSSPLAATAPILAGSSANASPQSFFGKIADGNAKKRWLRQAIREEEGQSPRTPSPQRDSMFSSPSAATTAGSAASGQQQQQQQQQQPNEFKLSTPLKKRRFEPESISSDHSLTPPLTPINSTQINSDEFDSALFQNTDEDVKDEEDGLASKYYYDLGDYQLRNDMIKKEESECTEKKVPKVESSIKKKLSINEYRNRIKKVTDCTVNENSNSGFNESTSAVEVPASNSKTSECKEAVLSAVSGVLAGSRTSADDNREASMAGTAEAKPENFSAIVPDFEIGDKIESSFEAVKQENGEQVDDKKPVELLPATAADAAVDCVAPKDADAALSPETAPPSSATVAPSHDRAERTPSTSPNQTLVNENQSKSEKSEKSETFFQKFNSMTLNSTDSSTDLSNSRIVDSPVGRTSDFKETVTFNSEPTMLELQVELRTERLKKAFDLLDSLTKQTRNIKERSLANDNVNGCDADVAWPSRNVAESAIEKVDGKLDATVKMNGCRAVSLSEDDDDDGAHMETDRLDRLDRGKYAVCNGKKTPPSIGKSDDDDENYKPVAVSAADAIKPSIERSNAFASRTNDTATMLGYERNRACDVDRRYGYVFHVPYPDYAWLLQPFNNPLYPNSTTLSNLPLSEDDNRNRNN